MDGGNRDHRSYLTHDGYIKLQYDSPLSEFDQEKLKVILDGITTAYESNEDVEKCEWGYANLARRGSNYVTSGDYSQMIDDDYHYVTPGEYSQMLDSDYPYTFHKFWATNSVQAPTTFRLLYSIKMCDYLTPWNAAGDEELEEEEMPNREHLMKRGIKTLSCGTTLHTVPFI